MKPFARIALSIVLYALAAACSGPGATPLAGADGGLGAPGDGGLALDPCASNGSPLDTVGCNGGFATSDPAPRQAGGVCTGASGATLDSCEGTAICMGGGGSDVGRCAVLCDAGPTLVSTGSCPIGHRCHRFAGPAPLCLRDCDASHPCPGGLSCDAGRCLAVAP